MQEIITPYRITYVGKLADDHIINSEELGYSIIGASKISTAIIHYIFTGKVPKRNYRKDYQCVTSQPASGCYEWVQYIIPIVPAVVGYEASFVLGAELLFQTVWDGLKNGLTNEKNFETMADTFVEINKDNNDAHIEALKIYAQSINAAHDNIRDVATRQAELTEQLGKHFSATMPELVREQKNNAINLVYPVGNSCNEMQKSFPQGFTVVIDSPEADVIRSREQDSVGNETEYNCNRLSELNLDGGHCLLDVEGFDDKVVGQISDPVLDIPNNIYSSALDDQSSLILIGKPIIRDGQVVKIHISNARV